jgi:hypothetical protein
MLVILFLVLVVLWLLGFTMLHVTTSVITQNRPLVIT